MMVCFYFQVSYRNNSFVVANAKTYWRLSVYCDNSMCCSKSAKDFMISIPHTSMSYFPEAKHIKLCAFS